jgi:hypothetical protein
VAGVAKGELERLAAVLVRLLPPGERRRVQESVTLGAKGVLLANYSPDPTLGSAPDAPSQPKPPRPSRFPSGHYYSPAFSRRKVADDPRSEVPGVGPGNRSVA